MEESEIFQGGDSKVSLRYKNDNSANQSRLISPKDNRSQVSGAINIAARAQAAHSLLFGILSRIISSSRGRWLRERGIRQLCAGGQEKKMRHLGRRSLGTWGTSVHHWYHMVLYWQPWLNPPTWARCVASTIAVYVSSIISIMQLKLDLWTLTVPNVTDVLMWATRLIDLHYCVRHL